jgi:hypothetical protein
MIKSICCNAYRHAGSQYGARGVGALIDPPLKSLTLLWNIQNALIKLLPTNLLLLKIPE